MAQDQSTAAPVALVHSRSAADGSAAAAKAMAPAGVAGLSEPSPSPAQPQTAQPQTGQPQTGSAAAPAAGAPKRGVIRRIVLPILILAAIGYGAKIGYEWFVEGRFIVSTDDAYVGADTAIIAAKASGHIVEVAVANNQAVHAGDLLGRIDPVDYQLAVAAARDKIASQEATIARVARQADPEGS